MGCAACCIGSNTVWLNNECSFAGGVAQLSPAVQRGCIVVCDTHWVRALPACSTRAVCRWASVSARSVVVTARQRFFAASSVAAESGRWFAAVVCTSAVAAVAFSSRVRNRRAVPRARHRSSTAVSAVQYGKYPLHPSYPGADLGAVK